MDLKPVNHRIEDYIIRNPIGSGQFGKVYLAINIETSQKYAIKRIEKSKVQAIPKLIELLKTEMSIMSGINHPNILHMYDFLETDSSYCLVLNYCNQGDYYMYLKNKGLNRLGEQDGVAFLKQIANGFKELRKHRILHRDFKPANVFLHNDSIVIGDFGFSKQDSELAYTKLGTPLYMAYEILTKDPDNNSQLYDSKADLWSVGTVYYEMLFGRPPFQAKYEKELIPLIETTSGPNLQFPFKVSQNSEDLLRRILTIDPNERISWNEFFKHPLFAESNGLNNSLMGVALSIGNTINARNLKFEREFSKNQEDKNPSNNVSFLNTSEIALENKNTLQSRYVKENEMNIEEEEEIEAILTMREILMRYNHERNILKLLSDTFKKGLNLLSKIDSLNKVDENVIQNFKNQMIIIMMLLSGKGYHSSNLIIESIDRHINIFNYPLTNFADFLNSAESTSIKENFAKEKKLCLECLSFTKKQAELNDVNAKRYIIAGKSSEALETINTLILIEYSKLKTAVENLITEDKTAEKIILHVLASIKSLTDDKNFMFVTNANGLDVKFDWKGFYETLQDENILRFLVLHDYM